MTDIEWIARNVHEWPTKENGRFVSGHKYYGQHHTGIVDCKSGTTEQQWLADRARLQNKPSWDDAPDWAKALGQDLSGYWQWLPHYDPTDLDHEEWMINNVDSGLYERSNKGEVLGDWRDTLERRPDADTTPELDYGTERDSNTATPAHDFLSRALGHMNDRASTYDNEEGERSMASTVGAFNAITGRDLTEEEGWLFMIMLKCARTQQGEFKSDNYEDGAAYFGLMGESASRDRG